jgi:hypothetical protein
MTASFEPSAEKDGKDTNDETPGGATTVVSSSSPVPLHPQPVVGLWNVACDQLPPA